MPSIIDQMLNRALDLYETTQNAQTFTWRGVDYYCTATQEQQEQDWETTGKRTFWKVVIEATIDQFAGTYPPIKDKVVYNGRTYTVELPELDAHTYKFTGSTKPE